MLLPISIFTACFQGSDRPAIPPNQQAVHGGSSALCVQKTIPTALRVQVLLPNPSHTLLLGPFMLFPQAWSASPFTSDKPSLNIFPSTLENSVPIGKLTYLRSSTHKMIIEHRQHLRHLARGWRHSHKYPQPCPSPYNRVSRTACRGGSRPAGH